MRVEIPLQQRIACYAQAIGSSARTRRGQLRYILDCPRALPLGRHLPPAPEGGRPALTTREREDRRAASDPKFRAALLRRLRRGLVAAQRDYGLDRGRWAEIAARIAALGGRSVTEPSHLRLQATDDDAVYAAAVSVGAPVGNRRAKGWIARTTVHPSSVREVGSWTGWDRDCNGGEERCRENPVANPGAARRAGYRTHYHAAESETRLRAIVWVAAPDRLSVLIHDSRLDLPIAAGVSSLIADGDHVVATGADGAEIGRISLHQALEMLAGSAAR